MCLFVYEGIYRVAMCVCVYVTGMYMYCNFWKLITCSCVPRLYGHDTNTPSMINFNPLVTGDAFWCHLTLNCMLSVGTIHFEAFFAIGKKWVKRRWVGIFKLFCAHGGCLG